MCKSDRIARNARRKRNKIKDHRRRRRGKRGMVTGNPRYGTGNGRGFSDRNNRTADRVGFRRQIEGMRLDKVADDADDKRRQQIREMILAEILYDAHRMEKLLDMMEQDAA